MKLSLFTNLRTARFLLLLFLLLTLTFFYLFRSGNSSYKHLFYNYIFSSQSKTIDVAGRNLPSSFKPTIKKPGLNVNLTATARSGHCVREVLDTLRLPKTVSEYVLETLQHPLPLTKLSPDCRQFLTPKAVSPERLKKLACFKPEVWLRRFSEQDYDRIRHAVKLLGSAFRKADILLLLDYGSALGSWRMHGRVSYDPDIDFAIWQRDEKRALTTMTALKKAHPNLFNMYQNGDRFWRMDVTRENRSRLMQIDIFVHKFQEKQQIIERIQNPKRSNVSGFIPFVQRPFEGVLFKTFRNMKKFIQSIYGPRADEMCSPSPWIPHHYKIPCGTRSVNCSELNYFYKFVHRWERGDGTSVEILFNRTHALSVFHSPE